MKERPLILFTLLSQLAVGMFVLLGVAYGLLARQVTSADQVARLALLPVTPLAIVGMLASFLHLGTPRNAWRALANIRSSWLSREILFAGLFSGLSGLYSLLQWFGWGSVALRDGLALLTSLSGLALVYSMARVYMLRSVLIWQSWLTAASFFATTFLLGWLALVTIYTAGALSYPPLKGTGLYVHRTLPWLGLAAALLLGIQILAAVWTTNQTRLTHHLALGSTYPHSPRQARHMQTLLALRLGLSAAGIALFLLDYSADGAWFLLNALVCFALALAGEAVGRYVFYSILE